MCSFGKTSAYGPAKAGRTMKRGGIRREVKTLRTHPQSESAVRQRKRLVVLGQTEWVAAEITRIRFAERRWAADTILG